MIVHDEGESDAGSTPCKDSTLIVRQVLAEKKKNKKQRQKSDKQANHLPHTFSCSVVHFVHSYPKCFSILFYVVLIMFCSCILCGRWRAAQGD